MDKEKKIAEIRKALEFNKEWWVNVVEGEPICQDEIDEVKGLIEANRFLLSELDRRDEENRKLRQELEEAKAEAELEGQIADDANSDLNEALGENGQLRQERDMYKSSSEVLYERLKKVAEQREKLIDGLRIATDVLGTVPMNDARLWGVYNKLCDILKEIGVTVDVTGGDEG